MDTKTNSAPTAAATDVSLIRGGPFYRVQQALRLIRPDQWNLTRRIIVLIAVSWLPLLFFTVLLNPPGFATLVREYRIYARLFIALPVLLVGESFMESRFRLVMGHIREAGLLDPPDLAQVDSVVARLIRVRDSFLPELIVLVLLIIHTATSYKHLVDATPWLGERVDGGLLLTTAGWYMVLISAPLFQFLLGLGLWRWLLWTYFAFKLSRQNLRLVATHPDGHGGLGFLGLTVAAFAPVALAASAVIGATWRNEILHQGAHLTDFKLQAIALAVIMALVALGPLLFFVPRLAALRRRGILEYGILGQLHSAEFEEKWIHHRAGHEAEFLEAADSSSLADFGHSYEAIQQLKPFPADRGALYALLAAVAVPMLPPVLAQIPLAVVLKELLEALR